MAYKLVSVACAASLGVSSAAMAQAAAGQVPAPAPATSSVDDGAIIVTAQRREQKLQDVPLSVTAQTASQLQTRGIANVQALGEAVPSLSVSSAVGFAITYLRGVGSTAIGPGIETPVSIYVDGVYHASSTSALFDFNNISRIEVLKGPQGTLFGRNATGGLIQVITKDPTQKTEMNFGASIDNYATVRGDLYAAGGVAENVAADISISASTQGRGWGKNLPTGADVNKNLHNISVRSKWIFDFSDSTRATLIGDYTDMRNSFNGQKVFPGTKLPTFLGANTDTGGPWDLNGDVMPRLHNRNWGVSLKLEQQLGTVALTSITAYRDSNSRLQWDIDFTPVPHFAGDLRDLERQFSQEFQLSSRSGGPLTWTAGAFYFRARGIYDPSQVFSSDIPNNLFGPFQSVLLFGNQLTESISGYAQGTLAVTPTTNITLGARYTYERRTIDGRTEAIAFGQTTPPILLSTTPHDEISFKKPTFRVALDHRFSPQVLGYVSFNTGFKSGGFNTQFSTDPAFLPETISAYEAGLKTDLFGNTVRLNFAGFYYDYKNIQVQKVGIAATGIINGASARIYGLEAELDARLSSALRLAGSVAYTNAKFRDFKNAPFTAPDGGVAQFPGDASGNSIPKSPRLQGNVSATYTAELENGSSMDFNLTGIYSSSYFFEANNIARQNEFAKLNASIAWNLDNKKYTLRVFANNITNAATAVYSSTLSDGTINVTYDAPRIVGVGFNVRY
ncbi:MULTISPECIES: TonB-dependent receptor [unclassified Novosphingobium]|uniref:TonB-dependent receptor n=1 Tax=unclassified Novosphingobium TaxID=2644732 RepID=UPI001494C86E|nr:MULTISPECIES: TonB-dependent receptor [unclassified Novosphingobium]MBB3359752.1 outer membrane receptor protein involved in Fe transport [Novosphingobium sp. BK256]MBB3376111.1 outer membrane receptor protein involved in Fe transport [Novosphingobium sp. BK280]MBB3380525.1 outer membrane receptor protein involved in Fe transport [Novosphingobium sp. BK258]MBB3422176.1 outer membrane receptor protein involved in Fe transport [Novosphingobium sp. BK267]MBB3450968.1 outer membrane receptor pr